MLVGRERGAHGWFSPGKHSYEPLLECKAVKDWISLYQSVGTRTYYLRCLEKVVKVSGLSPDKTVSCWRLESYFESARQLGPKLLQTCKIAPERG